LLRLPPTLDLILHDPPGELGREDARALVGPAVPGIDLPDSEEVAFEGAVQTALCVLVVGPVALGPEPDAGGFAAAPVDRAVEPPFRWDLEGFNDDALLETRPDVVDHAA